MGWMSRRYRSLIDTDGYNGGGGGIRTRETIHHRLHALQACAFDRSATPPPRRITLAKPIQGRNKTSGGSEHPERTLGLRWRKGAVERRQVLFGQGDTERAAVVAHMLEACGFRDHNHALLPQEPGERHLRRCRVPAAGDLGERAVMEQAALAERRISHDRDAALAAPRQKVPFGAAARQVV